MIDDWTHWLLVGFLGLTCAVACAVAVGVWMAARAAEEMEAEDGWGVEDFEEYLAALDRTRQMEGAAKPGSFGSGLTTRAAVPGFAPDRRER